MTFIKKVVKKLFRCLGFTISRYERSDALDYFLSLYPHCKHKDGFVYNVYGNMLYQNVTDHVNYRGLKQEQNLKDYGSHESDEAAVIINRIKPGMTVIDVGANIGLYTFLLARLVGNEGKVISFEPGPLSFSLLKANLIVNGFKNVTLENKAVTAKTQIEYYYSNQTIESGSTVTTLLKPDFGHPRERIEVETVSLDDYMSGNNYKIDYIKIDVEGGEYSALKGMTNLLKSNPGIFLTIEYAPYLPLWADIDLQIFLDFVRTFGFKIYDLRKSSHEAVSDKYLLDTYAKNNVGNYATLLLQRS